MRSRSTVSILAAVVCILAPAQVVAVDINFAAPVKLGDGQIGSIPTYGPGTQIIIDGNEINVAWSAEDPFRIVGAPPYVRNNEVRYLTSDDVGQSWERSDVIARDVYSSMQGVSLAVGSYQGQSQRHFAFGHRSGGRQVLYVNSVDRTPIDVTGGLEISVDSLSRSIAADASGNVFVCFAGTGGIFCSKLTTDLSGIASLDPAETALLASGSGNSVWGEPAIAMDASGTLFGAWSEQIGGRMELVLAKRISAGNWTHQIIDREGYEDYYTSIDVADVAGTKTICVGWSYYEIVVSCTMNEGATWNTSVVYADEWADWRPSVAIASDGTVNVAWAHTNTDSIKFARQLKDKKGSKWEVVEVDTQDYVMDVKLALDADDVAHLVYPGKDWNTLMYTKEVPVVPTSSPRP